MTSELKVAKVVSPIEKEAVLFDEGIRITGGDYPIVVNTLAEAEALATRLADGRKITVVSDSSSTPPGLTRHFTTLDGDLSDPAPVLAESILAEGGVSLQDKLDEIVAGAATQIQIDNSIETHNDDGDAHPDLAALFANDAAAAEAAKIQAQAARDAALLSRGVFASTADALSKGVASLASVVAGSGGTNGTFDLAFSGGAGTGAAGRFVVAGGAVVSTIITATGRGYTSAPTVSFAASSGLTGSSATAVIANNTDVGEYFSVPVVGSLDSLILYRVDSGPVATELTRYASADAVKKPGRTGLYNGWIDPFFRRVQIGQQFLGKERFFDNGYPAAAASMQIVPNTVFQGGALRKSANGNLYGPRIWLADMGVVGGDTISIYVLVKQGAIAGGTASCPLRPYSILGGATAIQQNMLTDGGLTFTVLGATVVRFKLQYVVPATTDFIWIYPITTPSTDMDVVALWAHKGPLTLGVDWPVFEDDDYLRLSGASQDALISQNTFGLSVITPAVNYAIDSFTEITASATSLTLNGTGFSAAPRDLVFMGWGENYTPAGISFNAVQIKSITRTVGASTKWRTLSVVVRTGANPHLGGSTVVAVGSAFVVETEDNLTDVMILLRDPVTNALKTLTDSDFSGGTYFIGVYALTGAGAPAACGEPLGTMPNTVGQSYYHSSSLNSPINGVWQPNSGNSRMGFQHYLLTSPVESFGYRPSQGLASDLGIMSAIPSPEMVMPPFVFGVQGRETNVYFDNLHLADGEDYYHDVISASTTGQQQNERWTWTPSGALASGTLTVAVHDKRSGLMLTTKTAQQRAAASSAGTGLIKKVIVIGDSLINAGVITQTLLDIAGADVMGVTLLGTRGTAPNKHEGRGGWTIANYTSNHSDGAVGANPFWIGGAVNFPQYLTNNSITTPDWVFIHLGINDVFGQTSDAAASSVADSAFVSLDTLIASIKAADANVKVGLMLPSPPSADQDSFGANYATGQTRWRNKRNILIWARQLIAKYAGQEVSRIYIVPSNTALDTVNNMSRAASAPVNSRSAVTIQRQNNGVHPATSGYQQIGDALWAFLKFYA